MVGNTVYAVILFFSLLSIFRCLIIGGESITSPKKYISFDVKISTSKALQPNGIDPIAFKAWFSQDSIPLSILKLNPGLEKVEELGSQRYRGYLKPIAFPGLRVTSIIDFETSFDPNKFEVACNDGAIKQTFEGNKILIKVFSGLTPGVISKTIWFVDPESGSLGNLSELQIRFGVPSWFPFDASNSQRDGSSILQKSLEADIDVLVNRIVDLYRNSEA